MFLSQGEAGPVGPAGQKGDSGSKGDKVLDIMKDIVAPLLLKSL